MDFKSPFEIISKITKIPFENDITALKIQLTLKGAIKTKNSKHVIIVLDKSGSMSGSPITQAKMGVLEMIEYLHNVANNKNITFITYESMAKSYDFFDKTLDQIKDIINPISGSGGTYFNESFKAIEESAIRKEMSSVVIVYLTDGQDSRSLARTALDKEVEQLGKNLKLSCSQVEAHTIGFTASHDVNLLMKLTQLGNTPGTFQYCKETKDIKQCVNSITGLLGGDPIVVSLNLPKLTPISLDLNEVNSDGETFRELECLEYIGSKELANSNKIELAIRIGDTVQILKITPSEISEVPLNASGTSVMTLKVNYIKNSIAKNIKQALSLKDNLINGKVNTKYLKEILDSVEKSDKQLDEIIASAFKLAKAAERKDIFPVIHETKDLISELYKNLRDLQSGQLNNDKIASLNAMAYRNITKRGLQKMLDKRTQQNVSLINDVYDNVKGIVKKLNFKEIEENYTELAGKIGNCVLSCNNFIEALKDEDCLCLTFDIGRSQAAIADPSQIAIKDIYPTFITAGSFMYSAEFMLKQNPLAHGGFEKNSEGLIIKGAAQENITGILPLYICKENWAVAKQIMKPALGWSTTLDPLGYTFQQVKTIPFLVLAKLINMITKNPNSDFFKFQFQLVLDTCIQIVKDASNPNYETKLSNEIKTLWEKYIVDPASRTLDVICNNKILLTQLYCCVIAGYIDKPSKELYDEFLGYVFEEELRRRTTPWNESVNVNQMIIKLLNLDMDTFVQKPFDEYCNKILEAKKEKNNAETDSFYEQKFLSALKGLGINLDDNKKQEEAKIENKEESKTEAKNASNPIKVIDSTPAYKIILKTNGEYNKTQTDAFAEYKTLFATRVGSLWNIRFLFYPKEENVNYESLKSFGIDNDLKFMCLYIQNKLQAKNANRRQAIESKKYCNPFTEYNQYLLGLYTRIVEEEKSSKITQFLTALNSEKSNKESEIFGTTKNINEAAGTLLGAYIGRNVTDYLKKITREGVPCIREKILMLVRGKYKGVKFYSDKHKNPGNIGWQMCRQSARRLWRIHTNVFTEEEWKALLPCIFTHSKRNIKKMKN